MPSFKRLLWTCLTLASLQFGLGRAKCGDNTYNPTVKQTQLQVGGFSKDPPKFKVEVENNCPMCPLIDLHLKCGSFSQQLVDPKLLKVLAPNNCVVNNGLPLQPLEKLYFNYSHPHKYLLYPSTWYFQCE
ncbi:hypothetical protein CEY00_Acc08872 [Actinidia chinensis var. chinensis]|uniref:Uncharacterized protein n=1 Tax=Actinidia chinensis var. chinensis TaxID=1590841 RepID=A0A2R6R8W8_ACTCC|nr:hypothetical protein CEY00_Acc08872 [Actinidia chinensis var. chinensis]